LKAGSTIGWFTMARRWAADRCGVAVHAGRLRRSIGSGRKKGVAPPPLGWASWATWVVQADWPAGLTGPKARKEFFQI
jgi:hypothetical protein